MSWAVQILGVLVILVVCVGYATFAYLLGQAQKDWWKE
jgi:hypothetical protein